MDPVTVLSIFSAVVAAVWTAWTWKQEHREVRQQKRDQAAALYVNPFLVAAFVLNRRLQAMLDGADQATSAPEEATEGESPSSAAIETLWTFAEFFAWEFVNLRYGPYTRDPDVIGFTMEITRAFDSRVAFDDLAFCFSAAEQASLSQAVLRRVGHAATAHAGEAGIAEFGILSAFEFEQDVRNLESPRADLYRGPAVRRAVEAIDRAARGGRLEGRARLAAVRRLVEALVEHLERLEGFSISLHPAGQAAVEKAVARTPAVPAAPAPPGPPRIALRMRGRVRLAVPRLKTDADYAGRLEAVLTALSEVQDVIVNASAGHVTVTYRTTTSDAEFQAKLLAAIEGGTSEPRAARRRPARARAAAG